MPSSLAAALAKTSHNHVVVVVEQDDHPHDALPTIPTPSPSPYFMCSKEECEERQASGEISIFEAYYENKNSSAPRTSPPNQTKLGSGRKQGRRCINPCLAMTKYRRSAAGILQTIPPRSLEQLTCCVSYLEYIVTHQQSQSPTTTGNSSKNQPQSQRQSLHDTVVFVEDRIRALQKDVTRGQIYDAQLQYRLVKVHLLILHLMANCPNYETKFGHQALQAAFAAYWQSSRQHQQQPYDTKKNKNNSHHQRDDTMLCWMALHHLQLYFLHLNDTNQLSVILDTYRRHVGKQQQQQQQQRLCQYPKFQWALSLLKLAVVGQPRSILRQLVDFSCCNNNNDSSFAIWCRLCMASAVPILRYQILQQYNQTLGKGEQVTTNEVARLLFLSGPQQAQAFACDTVGLTGAVDHHHHHANSHNNNMVVFKVGPVVDASQLLFLQESLKRDDVFVFGSHVVQEWQTHTKHGSQSLPVPGNDTPVKTACDDTDSENDKDIATKEMPSPGQKARVDADGMFIPPASVLYRLLGDDDA